MVLGLTDQGEVLWTYPVAFGMQEYPIEPVSAGQVLPEGPKQWLVAACDGSIHFLSADGKPLDHFNYGTALTGLAAARIDGKPTLLVATPGGPWRHGKCRSSRSKHGCWGNRAAWLAPAATPVLRSQGG